MKPFINGIAIKAIAYCVKSTASQVKRCLRSSVSDVGGSGGYSSREGGSDGVIAALVERDGCRFLATRRPAALFPHRELIIKSIWAGGFFYFFFFSQTSLR